MTRTETAAVLLILVVFLLVGCGVFGLAVGHFVGEVSALLDSLRAPA